MNVESDITSCQGRHELTYLAAIAGRSSRHLQVCPVCLPLLLEAEGRESRTGGSIEQHATSYLHYHAKDIL